MSVPVIACGTCGRNSGAHRTTCLYCGAALEGGGQVPAPDARATTAVPADLDTLFQQAMSGYGTQKLEAALGSRGDATAEEVASEAAAAGAGVAAGAAGEVDIEAAAGVLAQVQADSSRARAALELDPPTAAVAVASARAGLARLADVLPDPAEAAGPPPLELPAFRHALALVIEGAGEDRLTRPLAQALETDGVTARMAAMCRFPKAVLRSDDREDLERRAAQVRATTPLRAAVISRAQVLATPAPLLLLGLDRDRTWRATTEGLWLLFPPPDATTRELAAQLQLELPADAVHLAVRGEITTVLQRDAPTPSGRRGRKGSGGGITSAGETRRGVVDLHGPDLFVRLVEGLTDTTGLPGHIPDSTRRAFLALCDQLPAMFPGITVHASRICQPLTAGERNPTASTDADDRGRRRKTGWPTWEEHTRLCRLL